MKRWEYSGSMKALAIFFNQLCAIILILSVVICTAYAGSGIGIMGKNQSFESTGNYEKEVTEQIYRCIRAASRESKFETNGIYDGKILVDIEQYAKDSTIKKADNADGKLCYELADLLNWSLDGVETHTLMKLTYDDGTVGYLSQNAANATEQSLYDENGEEVASISTTSVGSPEAEGYEEEDSTEGENSSEESLPEDVLYNEEILADDVEGFGALQGTVQNVEQLDAVEEKYAPSGYESITTYAESRKLSTAQLQELYYDLEDVLSIIYNDYYAYTENLDLFTPSMTNMRYFVIPKNVEELSQENFAKKICTNMKSFGKTKFSSSEGLLDFIRSYGNYLIYDSSDMDYESKKMPIPLSDLSTYIKSYPPSVEGDYLFAVAVDTSYKASDKLAQYKQEYEEVAPVRQGAVYGVIVGVILYLLTMVYLTLAAGRNAEEEGRIILKHFDRIPSEPAALLLVLPAWGLLMGGYWWISAQNLTIQLFALEGGGLVFLLNWLFLIGYLSLVRRIKARVLWKNSILQRLMHGLGEMMKNRKVTTKVVIFYLGFLILQAAILFIGRNLGLLLVLVFDALVGIFLLRQAMERQQILDGIQRIAKGELDTQLSAEQMSGDNQVFAESVNQMCAALGEAVDKSVKDERLKSDLITNVSHDIKTPLTSIINYVELLKREEIENERAKNYIAILEDKAMRLKHLTDDLVEASKISSGNVRLELMRLNFQELIHQTNGEFSEKFEEKDLSLIVDMPEEPVIIEADGRRLWRVIENLYNNTAKYAMPHTRVYVELQTVDHRVCFSIKNISEQPLNIHAEELTERFIRGDVARSTEGSGLGLSIARNLTELQKGSFEIYLDGDLFKVSISFPEAVSPEAEETKES